MRKHEYRWISDFRFCVYFNNHRTGPSNEVDEWFETNVETLPYNGPHQRIYWSKLGYVLNLEEDVVLLLLYFGEDIHFVYDQKSNKFLFMN